MVPSSGVLEGASKAFAPFNCILFCTLITSRHPIEVSNNLFLFLENSLNQNNHGRIIKSSKKYLYCHTCEHFELLYHCTIVSSMSLLYYGKTD